MMNVAFALIALLILAGAGIAMSLRNLIHGVLLLVASWAGIALFYLWAGAEFAGFAQILVYVGAVSMVALFAVLLTRQAREEAADLAVSVSRVFPALLTGSAVAGVLAGAVLATPLEESASPAPSADVRALGILLMERYTPALLVMGAILTAALIGAVIIASTDRPSRKEEEP
jgi:NADH:ubiquinone oxidoreductase subunit 6 (subunit J)